MPSYRWPAQKRLKLHLVEHDLTTAWLSEQTDLSMVTLGGIMSGRVRPTPYTRGLIAEAVGVPAGSLFTNIDDPTDAELAEATS